MSAPEDDPMVPWTLASVAEVLNRLPFVQWDRLTRGVMDGWGEWFSVFGWIDRDDGRFDFVVLGFYPWMPKPSMSTSSARYSRRISELVADPSEHGDCERVEVVFADMVPNVVRIDA